MSYCIFVPSAGNQLKGGDPAEDVLAGAEIELSSVLKEGKK
jgi:hypothetical protein